MCSHFRSFWYLPKGSHVVQARRAICSGQSLQVLFSDQQAHFRYGLRAPPPKKKK